MTEPRVIANDLGFSEGPLWTHDGRLLVTSISHGAIYEIGDDGSRSLAATRGGPNGMAEGADGTLYVTQNGGFYGMGERSPEPASPGIQAIANGQVRYLAEDNGLDAPNDLCFGPDGRLYFTDPRGPATLDNREPGRVYAMPLDGSPELLVEGPAYANGIAFGSEPTQLFVAETFRQRVLVYTLRGGHLEDEREFCTIEAGFPDGMCLDQEGRLYVAATLAHEVQVFDEEGQRVEQLPCGDDSMPTNCCFGGPDGTTLFVTDSRGERVLAFDREVAGLALFPFR